jgi:hypothetical protein
MGRVGMQMEHLLDLEVQKNNNNKMKNIRIEEVGDINFDFPYLEVFFQNGTNPFLEIGITEQKELSFKYYASSFDITLELEDQEYILSTAKEFLPRALKNEDDFLSFTQ